MLSRRSVRIKVLQQLYALNRDQELTSKEALKNYDKSIAQSYELCDFSIFILLRIAEYATIDGEKRKKKHLKTIEDQTFTSKMATNASTMSLSNSASLEKSINDGDFDTKLDKDFIKKMYRDFVNSDEFATYLSGQTDTAGDQQLLLDLFRFCRNHELFKETVQDHYPNWKTDKSLVVGMIKKLIKALPLDGNHRDHLKPMDEEAEDFGKELLRSTMKHEKLFDELIQPKLENWDAERLAVIDTIVLRMALAELVYFPTIPKKVTLNEYVDISKSYSTAKSKDFINGLLDRLMTDLSAEGLIIKEGRGLME